MNSIVLYNIHTEDIEIKLFEEERNFPSLIDTQIIWAITTYIVT